MGGRQSGFQSSSQYFRVQYMDRDGRLEQHGVIFPNLQSALAAGHELTRDGVASYFRVVPV